MRRIDSLSAPLLVSWQLTKDCNLACLHCCTDSAPGRALPDELSREEALGLARQCLEAEVPYVMLCGGEPTIVPWFWDVAELLGKGGIHLKIETNGQNLSTEAAARLRRLPIRSIQVSLDGDTQEVYGRQRPGGNLEAAWEACRAVRDAGLPLEVTFAPTRINIHEAAAVIERAAAYGAFRFNTGALMRLGTAAKLWDRLEPSPEEYASFRAVLEEKEEALTGRMELCWRPFSTEEGLLETLAEPPATMLVLSNGWVQATGPLPFICADLRRQTLPQAWEAYRKAWDEPDLREQARRFAGGRKAGGRLSEGVMA